MVGLVVDIKGDTSSLDSALAKSSGDVKGFGGVLGSVGPAAMAATGGVLLAGAAIVGMTAAASEDRDEQNKLMTTIQAAGAAHGDYAAQVDAAIAAGQEKAFTDSQVRAGLEALVTATGDVGKATDLMTVAQDVARKSGVDLETASNAVAKAAQGQDGALRKLIPGLAKGATATDTIALASKAAAGQADNYAKSSAGMAAQSSDAFSEIGETIGSAFLPLMDAILPALLPVIKQFGVLIQTILPVLIPLIQLLGKVLGIVANVLSTVVGWIVKLVQWLSTAIQKVGSFLDSINPFKGIKLPSLPFLNSTSAAAGTMSASTRASGGTSGGVIINIYGDPATIQAQVMRALRTYDRRNAVLG